MDKKPIAFDEKVQSFFNSFTNLSSQTLNWCAIIIGHCVFIPTMLAIMTALTDNTPSIDVVILVQGFLLLTFLRAIVTKDIVALVLNGLGWCTQVVLFSLILFK